MDRTQAALRFCVGLGGAPRADGVLLELAQPITDRGFSVNYLLASEPGPRWTYPTLAPLLQYADALFDLGRELIFGEVLVKNWHLPAPFSDGVQECARVFAGDPVILFAGFARLVVTAKRLGDLGIEGRAAVFQSFAPAFIPQHIRVECRHEFLKP